jgi:hypothetical protein
MVPRVESLVEGPGLKPELQKPVAPVGKIRPRISLAWRHVGENISSPWASGAASNVNDREKVHLQRWQKFPRTKCE